MNLLALDSSTDTLSIAVQSGGQRWRCVGAGGAQSSARLLPAVRALMAQAQLGFAQLDAIVFGRGPGSFTGVRTACAMAQGLAFAHATPVLPIDTLLAVAEQARIDCGCTQVFACIDARMGEVYSAPYRHAQGSWQALASLSVCPPEAVAVPTGFVVAGNAQAVYGARLAPQVEHCQALPTADALLNLAAARLEQGQAVAAQDALPLYIRDKVAQTTAEREAAKAALAAARATQA